MARDSLRSSASSSLDASLPKGTGVIAVIALILIAGVVLIIRGLMA